MLLLTKLYRPPVRENFLPRPRLHQLLAQGKQSKLTLVTAPAGFGKTTLVANWLHQQETEHGWLALDEWDNDLTQFMRYLRAALGLPETAVPPPPHQPQQLAHSLLAELYPKAPYALVLDDYHLLTEQTIHQLMVFILEHLPPHIRFIFTTRQDPPFPLARWRVRQQLTEVRAHELRFTLDEATHFLNQSIGLTLPTEQVALLESRTEGWIAGLHMAALSLQNQQASTTDLIQAFTGHDRYIMDYLLAEVLQQLGEEKRLFLWQTAVLSRLSAPLCAHLIGQTETQAQTILEQMDQANLFLIPLDNQRRWWRYHHLFADLLKHQWQQQTSPTQQKQHHRLASDWFAQQGELEEAMSHLRQTGLLDDQIHFIHRYIYQLLGDSRLQIALNWLENLPQSHIVQDAYLCAACAWVYVLTGQNQQADFYLQAGEPYLANFQSIETNIGHTITRQELKGQYATLKGYLARQQGQFEQAITYTQEALAILPDNALTILSAAHLNLAMTSILINDIAMAEQTLMKAIEIGQTTESNIYVAVSAIGMMVDLAHRQANLQEAERRSKHPLLDEISGNLPILSMRFVSWAHIAHQRYQLEDALRYMKQAEEICKNQGYVEGSIASSMAEIAFTAGDMALVQTAVQTVEEKFVPIVSDEQILTYAWVYTRTNQPHKAQQWLQQHQQWQPPDLPQQLDAKTILYAQAQSHLFLLATIQHKLGNVDEALRLNSWLLSVSTQVHQREHELEQSILQAVLLASTPQQALPYLKTALEIGVEAGYRTPFIRYQNSLLPLLQQLRQNPQAQTLLREMGEQTIQSATLLEPLTDREQDVLHLLVQGHNSTQIAEQLVLATSTVRSYIKTIYSKLDVHNRVEAVQKAQHLFGKKKD